MNAAPEKMSTQCGLHSSLIGSSCPRIPSPNRPTYLLVQSLFLISSVHANVCESNNLQWPHCAEDFSNLFLFCVGYLQIQSTFGLMWKKKVNGSHEMGVQYSRLSKKCTQNSNKLFHIMFF